MQVRDLKGHKEKVNFVKWNTEGSILASCSVDRTIILWKSNGSFVAQLTAHTGSVNACDWLDSNILVSVSDDHKILIWNCSDESCAETIETDKVFSFVLCLSEDLIAVASNSLIEIYNMKSKSHCFSKEIECCIKSFTWNENRQLLAICTENGNVMFMNAKLEEVYAVKAHPISCNSIDFHADSFAVGSSDGSVSLWDMSEMICSTLIDFGITSVMNLSFNGDGRIAIGLDNKEIIILDVETKKRVEEISLKSECNSLEWSKQTNIIAFSENSQHGNNLVSLISFK